MSILFPDFVDSMLHFSLAEIKIIIEDVELSGTLFCQF